LGGALADLLLPDLAAVDLVVPVPLHWQRRWARGYNQAELIARPLAERLGVPLRQALRRRRGTTPQATLSREARRRNLKSPFAGRAVLAGERVLLVDDVVTTGATLHAAAERLRSQGAGTIIAAAVARTPREHDGRSTNEVG
jgi:ComF family protein